MGRPAAWSSGDAYEPYVGRWSRPVAIELLEWLSAPRGLRWLDLGCGTGALTQTLLATSAPRAVLGVDRSAAFVGHARERTDDPRALFAVADAQALPLPDAAVEAVVSGLVLNFVPQPSAAADEVRRVLGPGGLLGAYVWDYAEGMEVIRRFWDAAVDLDPSAAASDEAALFPLCGEEELGRLLRESGLDDVEVRSISVEARFRDFDDYWLPFLGGGAPAPDYALSLADDHRVALRERLRAELPVAADGSISLRAGAWAARGRNPATRR